MSKPAKQPLRVYLSYADQDRKRVDMTLRPIMRRMGIEILDLRHPESLSNKAARSRPPRGKLLEESTHREIRSADGFVVAISSQSMTSKHVKVELHQAFQYLERRIVPVALELVDSRIARRVMPPEVLALRWIDWFQDPVEAEAAFVRALEGLRSGDQPVTIDDARRVLDAHWDSLAKNRAVIGADIGYKETQGESTGIVAIRVYVTSKTPRNWLHRSKDQFPLPETLDGVPVDVLVRRFSRPANAPERTSS